MHGEIHCHTFHFQTEKTELEETFREQLVVTEMEQITLLKKELSELQVEDPTIVALRTMFLTYLCRQRREGWRSCVGEKMIWR